MSEPTINLKIALSRLIELGEWEIENPACPDPPPGWQYELKESCAVARQFLAEIREPAGAFFLSPSEKRHKLNGKTAKESDEMILKTPKKQQNSNDFQSEVSAIVRKFLAGEGGPMDPTHWLTKELLAAMAAKEAKTKAAPQPHPLFQTGYLGGTPPIAGGSNGKTKEQQKGIGLLDALYAANQRQNRRR